MTEQNIMKKLRKLAQYRSNDAVKLAFLSREELDAVDSLDLTGLAEFKRGSSGVTEIKFVDRLRVLELMDRIGQRENGTELGRFLSGLGKDEEQ